MIEEWKEIKGFDGRYSISNFGRIRQNDITYVSLQNKIIHHEEKIIEPFTWQSRYLRIDICNNKKGNKIRLSTYVHKLVAEYFIGLRPDGYVIDHIDGNYLNNRADNLRYVTRSENNNNPNTKPKMVEAVRKAFKNPELRQLISERTKEAMWKPEIHCKLGKGVKGKHRVYNNKEKTKWHFEY